MTPATSLLLPACAGAAAALAAWRLRAAAYGKFFGYARTAPQRYGFSPGADVVLDADGFAWPALDAGDDTALLEINVRASGRGRFAEPWIEAGGVRQYFERGCAGTRYLNVSALLADAKAGGRARLRAPGVTWSPRARLFAFANHMPVRPRVLVVAPHPDDAEIAAFGLYRSAEACVVTITAGERGAWHDSRLAAGDPAGAAASGRLRVADSITIPQRGGVPPERALNLGYPDGQLAALRDAPVAAPDFAAFRAQTISPLLLPRAGGPEWKTLVEDLAHLLREIRPAWIATPHPSLDDHPDHAFTTLAVCDALAVAGLADARLLLYVTHSPRTSLYPFGPAGSVVGPPPHFGEPEVIGGVYSHPLSPETQRAKADALAAHHDLAPVPAPRTVRSALGGIRGKITGLGREPTSFFRRAVRPNEFFFTLSAAEAPRLAGRFLAQWRTGSYRAHNFA